MAKTALIVDDSATARLALGRMLAEQDLAVDTAASGEEALDYLRQERPDVIFMDHLMPGMDGFQALEAIKENPATATIPVMMYTSQEGELYVGQARALGAFGVLPKQIEPVEVTKVLRALHLIPDAGSENVIRDGGVVLDSDAVKVGELLEDMFRQQRSMLREEIRKGYEMLSESASQADRQGAESRTRSAQATWTTVGAGAMLFGVAVFAFLYFRTAVLLEDANGRIAALVRTSSEAVTAANSESGTDANASASLQEITELLEWGINQSAGYRFSDTALDGGRAQQLAILSDRLRNAGFVGTVAVSVHVGRFCMNFSDDGTPVLPPTDQPVESCEQIGWPESEAQLLGERQTLPFANTISGVAREDGIRFRIVSEGSAVPAVGYPVFTPGLTAGEWNDIASRNHRVEVRIEPQ